MTDPIDRFKEIERFIAREAVGNKMAKIRPYLHAIEKQSNAWKMKFRAANGNAKHMAKRVKELEEAVYWALGERGEFPEEPPPIAGKWRRRYHWRTQLRALAFPSTSDCGKT
jgi:hypothetical protein